MEYVEQKAQEAGITVAAEEIRAVVEAAWLEDKRKEMPVVEVAELKVAGTE
jgi:hypothetical protein